MPPARRPRIFVSYSHDSPEHMDRVLALCDRLRCHGIDARIDQYETSPPEGWPRWCATQVRDADFVLAVCTEIYERRFRDPGDPGSWCGVVWEGALLTQELYEAGGLNTKLIPVFFPPANPRHIPDLLRGVTHFEIGSDEGFWRLYRRLTGQPEISSPPLGDLITLPQRRERRPSGGSEKPTITGEDTREIHEEILRTRRELRLAALLLGLGGVAPLLLYLSPLLGLSSSVLVALLGAMALCGVSLLVRETLRHRPAAWWYKTLRGWQERWLERLRREDPDLAGMGSSSAASPTPEMARSEPIDQRRPTRVLFLPADSAAGITELRQEILGFSPEIIHFSGNDIGLTPTFLSLLFENLKDVVKCVVLNTAHSSAQAAVIAREIEYVIGLPESVEDRAASDFSMIVYQALSAGMSLDEALSQAQSNLQEIEGQQITLFRRHLP